MSKFKNRKLPLIIKTETVDEFFTKVKNLMRVLDKNAAITTKDTICNQYSRLEIHHMRHELPDFEKESLPSEERNLSNATETNK